MAGPAGLPTEVLQEAQAELLDYESTGMSIMENSHRSKTFEAVHNEALSLTRELLSVPASHHILFVQGGASSQFALIPLNFLHAGKSADYINTGHWSERAFEEAGFVGKVRWAGATKDDKFTRVPKQSELDLDANAAYAHITTNNTIEGTQFRTEPDVGNVPLFADMSSDFLSRKLDVAKYGLIYAGAQKNLGPSGVVMVIVRDDVLAGARTDIPPIFRYANIFKANSLLNTPPTFAIYLVRGVLRWVKRSGGLQQIQAWNEEKAKLLYTAIDKSPDYYRCPIAVDSRSAMNVIFRLPSEALDDKFVKEASAAGMVGLKGYRTVGGIRASLYNAVSVANVKQLCDFMATFETANRP
jgi:phosphoserine aminotransferase